MPPQPNSGLSCCVKVLFPFSISPTSEANCNTILPAPSLCEGHSLSPINGGVQRMLNTERDTTRRQSQDLAKVQGINSNLEAEARVASDQRRQLQESAGGHSKKVQH